MPPRLDIGKGGIRGARDIETAKRGTLLASSSPAVQLFLLTITASVAVYARFAIGPLQETMRVALRMGDNKIALLQGPAVALPVVIAAVPLGLLIDRHSRIRLLFAFAAFAILGSLLTAVADNFLMLFAARCLVGLTAMATSMTAYAVMADLYEPSHRGRASMVVAIGEVGGASAAFALGGVLAAMFGSGEGGWRWAIAGLAVPQMLAIALLMGMREPVRTGRVMRTSSFRAAFAELWAYRSMISLLLTGRVMVGIADGAALIWAAPTLSRNYGLSPDRTGAIMAAILLTSGILGPIAGGLLADACQRFGGPRRTVVMLMVLALLCAPAGLFAVMPGVASASVLLLIFVATCDATLVMVMPLTTVVIPNELRGFCISILFAAGILFGVGLAPLAVSVLSGAMGGPSMIGKALALVCMTSGLIGGATFAIGRRYIPRSIVP